MSAALEGFNGFITIQFPTAFGFAFGFVVIETFPCSQDVLNFLIQAVNRSSDVMLGEDMYYHIIVIFY